MAPHGALVPAQHLDGCQFFSTDKIAYLKAQKVIDRGKHPGLLTVDGEGANASAERPHLEGHCMPGSIGHMQPWRADIGHVGPLARWSVDGVVCSRVHLDGGDDFPIFAGHHIPEILFQGREIHGLAIRGNGHAVTASFIGTFPQELVGGQIDALKGVEGGNENTVELGADGNPLDVCRASILMKTLRGNAAHETVLIIDVKYQQSMPSIAQVVTNTGRGHIEEMATGRGTRRRQTVLRSCL